MKWANKEMEIKNENEMKWLKWRNKQERKKSKKRLNTEKNKEWMEKEEITKGWERNQARKKDKIKGSFGLPVILKHLFLFYKHIMKIIHRNKMKAHEVSKHD